MVTRFHFAVAMLLALQVPIQRATAQECSELLHQGIHDMRSRLVTNESSASFFNWFCEEKFSTKSEADSFGGSLGFPFKGIPVKFGFDSSRESWSEWYERFCSTTMSSASSRSEFRDYVRSVNPQILDSFNRCIESDGLHVWLERKSDSQKFVFATRFKSPGHVPSVKITGFNPGDNVKCDPEEPIKGRMVDGSTVRVQCTRNDDKEVYVTVNAEWNPVGGGDLYLPEPFRPSETKTVVHQIFICSGESNCTGLTSNWPTPLGDCDVSINMPLPEGAELIEDQEVEIVPLTELRGKFSDFKITWRRPYFKTKVALCGYAPDNSPRRVSVQLKARYQVRPSRARGRNE